MTILDYPISYIALVSHMIRRKYSINDELAILRQRDSKPEEFAAYNAYCEQCKAEAKTRTQKHNEWLQKI